jgi:hypothetical protein
MLTYAEPAASALQQRPRMRVTWLWLAIGCSSPAPYGVHFWPQHIKLAVGGTDTIGLSIEVAPELRDEVPNYEPFDLPFRAEVIGPSVVVECAVSRSACAR